MASWDGYFSLAGVEIANEERFRAYVRNVAPWLPIPNRSPGEYEGTHFAVGDLEYTNPADDRAPWVDLDDPVTQDFLGMTILSVEGLENSTRSAGVTESLGKGGTVGYARDATREIRVTGLLVGLSSEAVQAGFTWLRSTLWGVRQERPIVPQLPGVSDLRFFAQSPDIPDQVVNRVLNPDASGLGESLVGTSGSAYAFRTLADDDSWSYRIKARTADDAEAQLVPSQRALAVPGQQWVAGATIFRPASMTGTRTIRLYLRFRDQYGNIIRSISSKDTTVPSGVLYRWTGARYDSRSQMLTPDGMLTNYIVNPSATGVLRQIGVPPGAPSKVEIVANTSLSTKRVYRFTANKTGTAEAWTSLAPADGGQQWWGRARGRVTAAIGSRHLRADLIFLDSRGVEVDRIKGPVLDQTTSGTFHRWRGTPGLSTSEEVAGDVSRINYSTNPTMVKNANGYTGWNATVTREKNNVFGSTYCLKVKPKNTNDVSTGVRIVMKNPVNKTIYFTFMIQSVGTNIAMRLSGEGFAAASGNSADLQFTATPTPTRVTIPIKMLTKDGSGNVRIIRAANAAIHSFRIGQVGFLDSAGAYFDGYSPNTGSQYASGAFDFTVGGVSPDEAASVRMSLVRINQGAVRNEDQFIFTKVMLTQQDPPDDNDDNEDNDPVATLPAYFDGDSPTTYEVVPAQVITSTDATKTNALVTATAPVGAVTAELAVERDGQSGSPLAGDTIYADNLFLADYTGNDVPDYTTFTQHDLVSETERWMQDVRPIAGPTVIQDMDLDCRGAATQVEFTLDAENPTWLRDNGDVVPIPRPTEVSGSTGAGAFALIEDSKGVVKNYMPQFSLNSTEIPDAWTTTADSGTFTRSGFEGTTVAVPALRVDPGSSTARSTTKIVSVQPLGPLGGFTDCVVSVWLNTGVAGAKLTVTVELLNSKTTVATKSATFTSSATSSADLYLDSNRVNVAFSGITGGDADGFRISVASAAGSGTINIGNPQATLGKVVYGLINAALPDDGTYTYGTDGAGFAKRTPVLNARSHTIFPNLTAPPKAISTLAGYDEVGLITYRTFAAIPGDIVPRNAAAVPVVRVDYDRFITRWVRFRFYPNPQNVAPEKIGTGTFTHEWVIDQFNGNINNYGSDGYMSLVIDGASRRVWLRAWDGTVIPGDQYVVTSDGSPIGWPEFRDIPWVVSVDYPNFRQSGGAPAGESWWRVSMGLLIEE